MLVAELSIDMTIGMTLASLHEQQGHIVLCTAAWPSQGDCFGGFVNKLLFNGT